MKNATIIVALLALGACNDAMAQHPIETEAHTNLLALRCQTLEQAKDFFYRDGAVQELALKGVCGPTREGITYVSKRIQLDGKPYACLRHQSERECRWTLDVLPKN